MGGKIECYLDIPSYYSYIAFVQLQRNREVLEQNGVEIEIHPFFLGAINAGSGNNPPWLLPAKAEYAKYDTKRAADALGLKKLSQPGNLMELAKTMLPMRAMTYVKSVFGEEAYLAAFGYLFHAFWGLHKIPNSGPVLSEVLSEVPAGFRLGHPPSSSPSLEKKLFTPAQVACIVEAAGTAQMKVALRARVDEALARGAFGAPWIWATDAAGRGEPFFGSDRWHCVYEFLGLPYRGLQLLPPQKARM
ncbi:thioredoxin-like protein [Xylaria palmicola]|nr:thioredoxin-like protein [Xylaria palmicola]